MNPLGNGNLQSGGLPPQLLQNIREVKGIMGMMRGNPAAMMQNNPAMGQIMQMCRGQNPQEVFKSMCRQRGLDADAIIKEFQN